MRPQTINPPGMPASPTISQAKRVGDLLFVSGQVAFDEAGSLVGQGDFPAQAEQTMQNLQRVLQAGGASLQDVVKVTNFLVDPSDYAAFNEVRRRYFPQDPPASSTVIVKALAAPDLLVEVEAVAVAPQAT